MKKLICAIAAVSAGICLADIQSANIVGYSRTEVSAKNQFAIFTPQFKGIGKTSMNIDELVPYLANGAQVGTATGTTTRKDKVIIQFMNNPTDGKYSPQIYWVPGVGWSYDKSVKHPDVIEIPQGSAIVVKNTVKANTSTGVESYTPTGTEYVNIYLQHSGEVDLEAQAQVPANKFALCGNMSFSETLNLDDLVPFLTNGVQVGTATGTTTRKDKVIVQFMNNKDDGKYCPQIYWVPGVGWSYDKTNKHTDTITFGPGEGYVVKNTVKANTSTGVESYTPTGTDFVPIVMKVVKKD